MKIPRAAPSPRGAQERWLWVMGKIQIEHRNSFYEEGHNHKRCFAKTTKENQVSLCDTSCPLWLRSFSACFAIRIPLIHPNFPLTLRTIS